MCKDDKIRLMSRDLNLMLYGDVNYTLAEIDAIYICFRELFYYHKTQTFLLNVANWFRLHGTTIESKGVNYIITI